MADLKRTLNDLVCYLDGVHSRALPTARSNSSSVRHVIRYARTSRLLGEVRQSADAHVVVACRFLGIRNSDGSALVTGRLKQAVIAARRGKRAGGNNAKWAQDFFNSVKRLGCVALQEEEEEAPVQKTGEQATQNKEALVEARPEPALDERQWGAAGANACWDDEEEDARPGRRDATSLLGTEDWGEEEGW
jgi:hypothetical protein